MKSYIAIAAFAALVMLVSADLTSAKVVEHYQLRTVKMNLEDLFEAGDRKIKSMVDNLYMLAGMTSQDSQFRFTFSVAAQLMNSIRTNRRRTLTEPISVLKGNSFNRELGKLLTTAEKLNEQFDGTINNLFKIGKEYSPANHPEIVDNTIEVVKILHEEIKHIEIMIAEGEKYEVKEVAGRFSLY